MLDGVAGEGCHLRDFSHGSKGAVHTVQRIARRWFIDVEVLDMDVITPRNMRTFCGVMMSISSTPRSAEHLQAVSFQHNQGGAGSPGRLLGTLQLGRVPGKCLAVPLSCVAGQPGNHSCKQHRYVSGMMYMQVEL